MYSPVRATLSSLVAVLRFGVVLLIIITIVSTLDDTRIFRQAAATLNGPPPASGKQFTVLPPGATLPSSSECANRIRRTTWEPRPGNTPANQYIAVKGVDYNLEVYHGSDNGIWIGDHPQRANALLARVDANFKGTTDEVLQWAACKWGVDEDMVRAQAVVESYWNMSTVGDNGESHGILQVRGLSNNPGIYPASEKSTAFNADYTYARWRLCFEGLVDYLAQTGPYVAGDAWGCMGTWYTGNWYGSGGGGSAANATEYINAVKQQLQARVWETWPGVQVTQPPGQVTPSPTSNQTQPTATHVPGTTGISLEVFLHGLGKGGDNANANSGGNTNPLHPQRAVSVEISNANNQIVATKQGTVTLQSVSGSFKGTVQLDQFTTGVYTAKIKVPQFLGKPIAGILTITNGQITTAPALSLTAGDANNDNKLSILDYNMLLDCFSDLTPAKNCADSTKKLQSDLTDDGNVNQFDYNLFLRELSVQSGG